MEELAVHVVPPTPAEVELIREAMANVGGAFNMCIYYDALCRHMYEFHTDLQQLLGYVNGIRGSIDIDHETNAYERDHPNMDEAEEAIFKLWKIDRYAEALRQVENEKDNLDGCLVGLYNRVAVMSNDVAAMRAAVVETQRYFRLIRWIGWLPLKMARYITIVKPKVVRLRAYYKSTWSDTKSLLWHSFWSTLAFSALALVVFLIVEREACLTWLNSYWTPAPEPQPEIVPAPRIDFADFEREYRERDQSMLWGLLAAGTLGISPVLAIGVATNIALNRLAGRVQ